MSSHPPASTCTPANEADLQRAAQILRAGGLVAFPTETVYGLGAHAWDEKAVAKIYAAKARPTYNPLIVHAADQSAARQVLAAWPPLAQSLAQQFWPGPLTLVLPKNPRLPGIVTAGLQTVGVRVPAHPIARRLLEIAQMPVAAPSANRFMQLSPTHSQHVWKSLGPRVDLILEGGASSIGIESTVLDCSQNPPLLLRPGAISQRQIEAVIGPIAIAGSPNPQSARPSPGMLDRHYAPQTPALRFDERADACKYLQNAPTLKIGLILLEDAHNFAPHPTTQIIVLPRDAPTYAQKIYASLHQLDEAQCALILIETPPPESSWQGVRDRIFRATQPL